MSQTSPVLSSSTQEDMSRGVADQANNTLEKVNQTGEQTEQSEHTASEVDRLVVTPATIYTDGLDEHKTEAGSHPSGDQFRVAFQGWTSKPDRRVKGAKQGEPKVNPNQGIIDIALTLSEITFQDHVLRFDDVIGVQEVESGTASDGLEYSQVRLIMYPKSSCLPLTKKYDALDPEQDLAESHRKRAVDNSYNNDSPRELFTFDFWFSLQAHAKWFVKVVRHVLARPWLESIPGGPRTTMETFQDDPPVRRVRVFINPASGAGQAQKTFQQIEPMLAAANIHYTPHVTSRAGEVQEYLAQVRIDEYHGHVIISGDGLMYEAVNAVMSRPDWREFIEKVTFSHIPGGSGNGLASSIAHASHEAFGPVEAAYLLCKGYARKIDLFSVAQPDEPLKFGFLSVTWAVIADSDFESEKCRCFGNARFFCIGMVRGLCLRHYTAKMEFLPVEDDVSTPIVNNAPGLPVESQIGYGVIPTLANTNFHLHSIPATQAFQQSQEDPLQKCTVSRSCRVCAAHANPEVKAQAGKTGIDGLTEFLHAYQTFARTRAAQLLMPPTSQLPPDMTSNDASASAGDADPLVLPEHSLEDPVTHEVVTTSPDARTLGAVVVDSNTPLEESKTAQPAQSGVQTDEHWAHIEDNDFTMIMALNMTHIGSTNYANPHSHMSEGVLHLMYTNDVSSCNMTFCILDKLAAGAHLESSALKHVRVSAFRLDPTQSSPRCTIALDGERMPDKPIEVRAWKSILRVYSK